MTSSDRRRGANLPDDAIYPTAFLDGDGRPLNSTNRYVLHFDKGKLPPADAFWSITDGEPVDRIGHLEPLLVVHGDRDKLTFNADGSLDLYIQSDSPGKDKESNWLPAPKAAPFAATMRIYAPRPESMNGTWTPPPIKRRK